MSGQPPPGPWMFEEQWHGTAIKTEDGTETVARVSPRSDFAKEIATARLLAVSPELLAAADAVLEALGRGGYAEPPLAQALTGLTKAVAKAKGRE